MLMFVHYFQLILKTFDEGTIKLNLQISILWRGTMFTIFHFMVV